MGRRDEDLVVLVRPCALVLGHQLLEQLLARPRAGEHDRDVDVGLEAREADQVLDQVEDTHRLAHVEDVDLAVPCPEPTPAAPGATPRGSS
jgi:hypothetical protein